MPCVCVAHGALDEVRSGDTETVEPPRHFVDRVLVAPTIPSSHKRLTKLRECVARTPSRLGSDFSERTTREMRSAPRKRSIRDSLFEDAVVAISQSAHASRC